MISGIRRAREGARYVKVIEDSTPLPMCCFREVGGDVSEVCNWRLGQDCHDIRAKKMQ